MLLEERSDEGERQDRFSVFRRVGARIVQVGILGLQHQSVEKVEQRVVRSSGKVVLPRVKQSLRQHAIVLAFV